MLFWNLGTYRSPSYISLYLLRFYLFSKKREVVPDLAPMLWHSFGTTAALLQEIINIYPAINPATLTAHQSNRYVIMVYY